MNIFVFDIETIPDTDTGRKVYELPELSIEDTGKALFHLHQQESGNSFLPHYLQKIIAISVVLRTPKQLKVWSLGDCHSTEQDLIERFFAGIEKYTPVLVSWNGSGFDLPVIHYRALLHGIPSTIYWENGEFNAQFKWNNYLNRFHERHTDVMDILSGYQGRACTSLDKIATLLNLPGKMVMSGDNVWDNYLKGKIEFIRNYCEIDVLNTFLIFLRFQLIRGRLTKEEYENEILTVKSVLEQEKKSHFNEFLQQWNNKNGI